MWLCTNTAFLSIVHKDCAADELLVRARRKGDIESIFPDATVEKTIGNDYLFRARIKRAVVGEAMLNMADSIKYSNFKNSVRDNKLHGAYNRIWHVMADLQPIAPFAVRPRQPRSKDIQ